MRIFSLFTGLVLAGNTFGQLDQGFFTTYFNENMSESYIVYLPEDNLTDCFWVEHEVYDENQTIFGETGIGSCETGKMIIYFESKDESKISSFSKDTEGFHQLIIENQEGESETFYEQIDEGDVFYDEAEETSELYFTSDAGNLLTVFDDPDGMGFNIIGTVNNGCDKYQLGGILEPIDDGGEFFTYKDGSCIVNFNFTEDGVFISTKNCKISTEGCSKLDGTYYFND